VELESELAMEDLRVLELARTAKSVRVRISNRATVVEGWVDRSALGPAHSSDLQLASLSTLGRGSGPSSPRCPHGVAIYVRDGGAAVRVGVVRANAPIPRLDSASGDEIAIELGARETTFVEPVSKAEVLQPFVRRAALEDCGG